MVLLAAALFACYQQQQQQQQQAQQQQQGNINSSSISGASVTDIKLERSSLTPSGDGIKTSSINSQQQLQLAPTRNQRVSVNSTSTTTTATSSSKNSISDDTVTSTLNVESSLSTSPAKEDYSTTTGTSSTGAPLSRLEILHEKLVTLPVSWYRASIDQCSPTQALQSAAAWETSTISDSFGNSNNQSCDDLSGTPNSGDGTSNSSSSPESPFPSSPYPLNTTTHNPVIGRSCSLVHQPTKVSTSALRQHSANTTSSAGPSWIAVAKSPSLFSAGIGVKTMAVQTGTPSDATSSEPHSDNQNGGPSPPRTPPASSDGENHQQRKDQPTSNDGTDSVAVRQEWIDAVFGRDWSKWPKATTDLAPSTVTPGSGFDRAKSLSPSATLSGIGQANLGPYAILATSIPAAPLELPPRIPSCGASSSVAELGLLPPSPRKMGLTIHRLALGLCVQRVVPFSEAYYAGISEGSILVEINGLPLLAEPSKVALERLWLYEGHFAASSNHHTDTCVDDDEPRHDAATTAESNAHNELTRHMIQHPVVLKFYLHGNTSSVIFLSNPPYGIRWATCGAFALVHRVRSLALEAGVPRGSLICRIDDCSENVLSDNLDHLGEIRSQQQRTLRELDHVGMARYLQSRLDSGHPINLYLGFPPIESRASYFEKRKFYGTSSNSNGVGTHGGTAVSTNGSHHSQIGKKGNGIVVRSRAEDGIEVKFHPLDLAQFLFCPGEQQEYSQQQMSSVSNVNSGAVRLKMSPSVTNHDRSLQSHLAEEVAAGRMEAATGFLQYDSVNNSSFFGKTQIRNYDKSTTDAASSAQLPLSYASPYCSCPMLNKDDLLEAWDPLEALVYCVSLRDAKYDGDRFVPITSDESEEALLNRIRGLLTNAVDGPAVVASFLLQFISLICAAPRDTVIKADSKTENFSITDDHATNNVTSFGRTPVELTAMLLRLSRRDEGFCQRLYFVLRSFISTFETRPPSVHGPGDNKENLSHRKNLLALLHCLELLRFAEKELASRTFGPRPQLEPLGSMDDEAFKVLLPTNTPDSPVTALVITALHSAGPNSTGSSRHPDESPRPIKKTKSPRRVGGGGMLSFFRKKKYLGNADASGPATGAFGPNLEPAAPKSPHRSLVRGTFASAPGGLESRPIPPPPMSLLPQSPSTMYDNMSEFLGELDKICLTIERSLQKSFRQKIAEWAMQPWSSVKDTALANVTVTMRDSLRRANKFVLVNPVESSELLSSVDHDECYILPSAHFPILLTFNVSESRISDTAVGEERLYKTRVELLSVDGALPANHASFVVHGAIGGTVLESGESSYCAPSKESSGISVKHVWQPGSGSVLEFITRSSWGAPNTLSLRLATYTENLSTRIRMHTAIPAGVGFSWIDLSQQWIECSQQCAPVIKTCSVLTWPIDIADSMFDEHGSLPDQFNAESNQLRLELKVTTHCVDLKDAVKSRNSKISSIKSNRKRLLLYKHDDDLRQEAFTVQYIRNCDEMLKAAGLDLKLLTFQCIPVGARRGFVEWVPGSIPLSEICHPSSATGVRPALEQSKASQSNGEDIDVVMGAEVGPTKYRSLHRFQQIDALHQLGTGMKSAPRGSLANNPIQDYLRSVAYDADAPYLIRRNVIDTYVKSCAGYSIITYILGIGDRHLDNLLLHQSGAFFHCDFSFILGSDPKTYLPMRVTEDMIYGMGGKDSDNYAKFLSLASAAFLALRRPENVRVLLSMVRLMEASWLPDISENQSIDQAILGIRERLRLDLTVAKAVAYIEELIQSSFVSKIWLAVDAIHNLGKKF